MKIKIENRALHSEELKHLERITAEEPARCYQCGNCSAGCPLSYIMDYPPSQMIRLLQLGRIEEAKKAESVWLCVSCMQCYARCPKDVSAGTIFEGLRQLALREGEDYRKIKELHMPFLKGAPQQALVCGFRKFVS